MDINDISIEYNYMHRISSSSCDGIRHIKTLPYLSIVQAVEGSYDIQIGDGNMENTGEGGFFIAPSDVVQDITHHMNQNSKIMVCRWIFIRIKINRLYDMDALYTFPVILPEKYKKEMNEIFNGMFATDDAFEKHICFYKIARILSLIAIKKKQDNPAHLEKALSYIRDNYKSRMTTKMLSKTVNLSESHFYAVFKKYTGISPNAYINNYRLSMATEKLLKSDDAITQIADSVGISDSVYFNKMFRKAYQMSPSEYRKMYKRL